MTVRLITRLILAGTLLTILPACHSLPGPATARPSPPDPASHGRCPDLPELTDQQVATSFAITPETLARLKTNASLSNQQLCSLPEKALRRALAKLERPKPDQPGAWAAFRSLQRRDDCGTVREDGLIQGLAQRQALLRAPDKPPPPGAAVSLGAGVTPPRWEAIGPGNIGGRIRSILIDPNAPDRLWIGSVSGGIWHSSDAGASWRPVDDFLGNLSVSSLVMIPGNPDILFAGTGEGFYNGDAVRGAGIFASPDGGISWSQLPGTNPATNADWYYVNRLALQPGNGSLMLAATRGGIYRSIDGQVTWSKVHAAEMLTVAFNLNDPAHAIAGGPSGTVAVSFDAGASWSSVTITPLDWQGRVEVAFAPSRPNTVYATVNRNNGELWRSTNGGLSWSLISAPQHFGGQGWYNNALWVDPTDDRHLVIGGIDLWRSTDGGTSWSHISSWANNMYYGYPQVPHADHHVIVAEPGYNGTTRRALYSANDGGIFRAPDITLASETSGWQRLNHGLAITQFFSGAGSYAAGGRIIGGTMDNGSLLFTGNPEAWTMYFGGDGGRAAVDPQDDSYLYSASTGLLLHRSTDGGATASFINSGIADVGVKANFVAPFVLDPGDPNRLLIGGASLWQSRNVKDPVPIWAPIKPPAPAAISAIAVAAANPEIVWVGHNNGEVYRTETGLAASPTWIRVGAGSLPARMVTRILLDNANPDLVFVTFGGYAANNLFRTTDGGQSWTNIAGNLPQVPIFSLVQHPVFAGWLYAGTEVGLFTSENNGLSWFTSNDGPANVEISDLSWLDSTTLLAATHGRGMFTIDTVPDLKPPTVTSTVPADAASAVPVGSVIRASFSERMDPATLSTDTFSLDNGVTGTVSYDDATQTATFTPQQQLAPGTTFRATISTGAKDVSGNHLAGPVSWSFTTAGAAEPVVLLTEDFSAATIPAGWSVVDNSGSQVVWAFNDPGNRTNLTGGTGGFAIADSDRFWLATLDTELRTPALDLSRLASASLRFKSDFIYLDESLPEVADVDVSVNGPAGPWQNVWRRTATAAGPRTESVDLTAVAAGRANVMIRFRYYNARYEWWWEVDDVSVQGFDPPPETTITGRPAGLAATSSGTFAFTASESGSTFTCRIDGAVHAPCSSPFSFAGLGDGLHTFAVRATDPAGNVGAETSCSWTVDTTPPTVQLTGTPGNPASSSSATFVFSSPDPAATFRCALDGEPAGACISPRAYAGLAGGSHSFSVTAVDPAGNSGLPASFGWTIASCTVMLDSTCHPSLAAAYQAITTGGSALLKVREGELSEGLIAGRPVSAAIQGGFAANFMDRPGTTALVGTLTISVGTIIADGITIR